MTIKDAIEIITSLKFFEADTSCIHEKSSVFINEADFLRFADHVKSMTYGLCLHCVKHNNHADLVADCILPTHACPCMSMYGDQGSCSC